MSFISTCFNEEENSRILFTHTNDYLYNDQKWVTEVQLRISALILEKNAKVGIIGLKKDASSFYLELFPQWEYIPQEETKVINATAIRELYFDGNINLHPFGNDIPISVKRWLFEKFFRTPHYEKLRQEHEFLKSYKLQWKNVPYPVIFTTVDAVVVQSGHVLMIKRKACPGEGLWAIPGGFLNINETILKGMLRELKEETKINVPVPVLEGHIKTSRVFDHPQRSERGRTITHAYLIELPAGPLPKVKGGDDASKAFWVPLEDIEKKSDMIYEDHASLILNLVGRL
jgi:bifunctional NMN adenylyltransferase/nudix hydrolase